MLTLLLTTLAALTASPATRPAAVPVAAVWHEFSPHPNQTEMRRLSVGVWSDGTIVWNEKEPANDKAKYLTARVQPRDVEKLLNDLDKLAFFDDPDVNQHRNQYPPDASYIAVAAEWHDKQQRLASWREPPASGSDRWKEVFMAAKKRILDITPAEGKPIEKIDESVYRLGRHGVGGGDGG